MKNSFQVGDKVSSPIGEGHIIKVEGKKFRVLPGSEKPSESNIKEWNEGFFAPGMPFAASKLSKV